MKRKLTSAMLTGNLAEGEYWDSAHAGLHIRVGRARSTWLYRFRSNGKQRRQRLGYWPTLTLAQARSAAGEIDQRLDSGLPAAAVQPAPVHPRSDRLSLGALIDKYEVVRQREGGRIKNLRRSMMALRFCLRDFLGVPAETFSKRDLRAARDAIIERGKPAQANMLLRVLSPVMAWASQEDLVEHNFVPAIRKSPSKSRSRVLTPDELRRVWNACANVDSWGASDVARSYARLVQFLALVGCRLSEGAGLKYGDILDGNLWTQSTNKSNRPHRLRLPAAAVALLGTGTANELCFPGRYGGVLTGTSKAKHRLDEAADVHNWVIHDLRRGMVSGLGDLGVDQVVIRACINHNIASGALSAYFHSELEVQKTAALQLWATYLEKIISERRPLGIVESRK